VSRKFQDENFLVWEAYPSASRFGFSDQPNIVFNCLTDRFVRARFVPFEGDEADAERAIVGATPAELLELLHRSREMS
jgi:hypothetical protein